MVGRNTERKNIYIIILIIIMIIIIIIITIIIKEINNKEISNKITDIQIYVTMLTEFIITLPYKVKLGEICVEK